MCANHVYHCASITNLYTIRELCLNGILLSYWFVDLLCWVLDEFVKVLFWLLNQWHMSNTYWYIFFQWERQREGVMVRKLKRWSNQQAGSDYISLFCVLAHFSVPCNFIAVVLRKVDSYNWNIFSYLMIVSIKIIIHVGIICHPLMSAHVNNWAVSGRGCRRLMEDAYTSEHFYK